MSIDGVGEVDATDLLEELGLENVLSVGQGEVRFSCPFTEGHAFGDAHPSAHMNRESHLWRCKTCQRAGHALDLIGSVLRLSPVETVRWLRERYGDAYRPLEGSASQEMRAMEDRWRSRRVTAARIIPDEEQLLGHHGIFEVDWDSSEHEAVAYMRGRGFTPETLRAWRLGFDTWTRRVAIPVRDPTGQLVGFKGRAIDPGAQPKYTLLGDTDDRKPRYGVGYGFTMHDPAGVVFALDRAVGTSFAGRRRIVLAEGELNAVALHQAGIDNAVAVGTTTITDVQKRLLRWYSDEVILFYDTDDAGRMSTWGYFDDKGRWHPGIVEQLSPYMRVHVVDDHEGDPAEMEPEQIRSLVASARSWLEIAVA